MCGRANFSRVSKLWKAGFDAGVHGAVFGTDGPACFFSSGAPESQWASGAAALDSLDAQVFARDLLRKVQVAPGGLARIPEEGEQSGLATHVDGGFLLDSAYHSSMLEGLAVRGVPLRANRAAAV